MSKLVPRIAMCRPTYYRVEYSINVWMGMKVPVDQTAAMGQWKNLKKAIQAAGADVTVMEPTGGMHLPDMVFIANAAIIRGNAAYLANFKHPQRRGEQKLYGEWLRSQGYYTFKHDNWTHEGTGDALFAGRQGNVLFSGVGPRSQAEALDDIKKMLSTDKDSISVQPVKLVDNRFYHLDTCFCPLEPGRGIWYRKAFDRPSQEKIMNQMEEMIEVSEKDAANFACNAVVVGKNVIMHEGSEDTAKQLEKAGYKTLFVNMSEFIKAGGSAKCCTLRLE